MKNNYFYNETNFDCLDAAYKPLLPIEQKSVPLRVPPLQRSEEHDNHVSHYTIVAQEGEIQILDGPKTKTWGYNGDILGPTIRFTSGETYTITLVNQLPEVTTFHWHGLNIPGPIEDGGPFAPVKPGESKTITFTVNQPASTCWLHPHPCPNTASQVWHGLAAMVIVSDAHEASLDLPRTYGVDDIPLILQDRSYHDNQLDYQRDYDADGIQGNVALINGGVNATFDVTQQRIRLRVLNGANRKEFRLHLDDDLPMTVIASDASLLPKPITLTHLMLTVAERSEFILDFSDYKLGDCVVLYSDNCPILTFRIKEFARNKQNSIQTNFSMAPLVYDPRIPVKNIVMYGMDEGVLLDGRRYDMKRIDAYLERGVTQYWDITNVGSMTPGMIHPFHVHGAHFQVLSRNGQEPYPYELGWKDTIGVNTDETVRVAIRFDIEGLYMYHCHILEHEDTGMMAQIQILPEAQ